MTYYMGLDPGQAADYSACVVLDQQRRDREPPVYTCVLAHRWPLQTSYPDVIATLHAHLRRPEMTGHYLCVDYTGVGRPVIDELRRVGLACTGVSIHGGVNESRSGFDFGVPKRTLVAVVQVLLQSGRLKFAKEKKADAFGDNERFPFHERPYEREVEELVSLGHDELCRRVGAQVVAEHGDAVFLNRCPRCHRIPTTLEARQCRWCHHDWH